MLKLTAEQARELVCEGSLLENGDEAIIIISNKIADTSRWTVYVYYDIIVHDKPSNTYWSSSYRRCATEYQWEHDEPVFTQVWPKKVTTTVYTQEKPDGA